MIILQMFIYSMVKDRDHASSLKAKQHDTITVLVMKDERYVED